MGSNSQLSVEEFKNFLKDRDGEGKEEVEVSKHRTPSSTAAPSSASKNKNKNKSQRPQAGGNDSESVSISDDEGLEGLGGLDGGFGVGGLDGGGGIIMGDTGEVGEVIEENRSANVSVSVSPDASPRTARTIASEAESGQRGYEDDDFED